MPAPPPRLLVTASGGRKSGLGKAGPSLISEARAGEPGPVRAGRAGPRSFLTTAQAHGGSVTPGRLGGPETAHQPYGGPTLLRRIGGCLHRDPPGSLGEFG